MNATIKLTMKHRASHPHRNVNGMAGVEEWLCVIPLVLGAGTFRTRTLCNRLFTRYRLRYQVDSRASLQLDSTSFVPDTSSTLVLGVGCVPLMLAVHVKECAVVFLPWEGLSPDVPAITGERENARSDGRGGDFDCCIVASRHRDTHM